MGNSTSIVTYTLYITHMYCHVMIVSTSIPVSVPHLYNYNALPKPAVWSLTLLLPVGRQLT